MLINEDDFLRDLLPKLATDGNIVVPPGDDCAVLSWNDERYLLLTVDQVAEGVHYHGESAAAPDPAYWVGRKLLARNISDIAAMGGTPSYGLLAISMRKDASRQWLDGFTQGILDLAAAYYIKIVGGDTSAAMANVASLTLLGRVHREQICLRSRARPGDRIFVTGTFGGSLVTGKHLRFEPRLQEAQWLATHGFTSAMIDVSDGLLVDLTRLCRASNVTAVVMEDAIPRTMVDGIAVSLSAAMVDGEDYELIFAASQHRATDLAAQWPFATKLTDIGHIQEPNDESLAVDGDGIDLMSKFGSGYDHFRE